MTPTDFSTHPRPLLTIRPSSGWAAIDLREMWHFRDLFLTLAERDVKVRYKQTALGAVWVIIQPLLSAGVLSFVFGSVAKLEAPGKIPYFLFAFAGTLAFSSVFSSTLTRVTNSMVGNQQLVSKVYFPRLILPFSTTSSTLLDFIVGLGMFMVLLLVYWQLPGANVLLMPVCVVVLLMLALGAGLMATAIAVSYRDVIHILPVATQFLLYASPVAYAVAEVPDQYLLLFYLNPLTSVLEAFRWSVFGVGEVPWGWFGYSAAVAVGLLIIGAFSFRRMERRFADVI